MFNNADPGEILYDKEVPVFSPVFLQISVTVRNLVNITHNQGGAFEPSWARDLSSIRFNTNSSRHIPHP